MVNNHIQVYARIKKETVGHQARYDVITDEDKFQTIKIFNTGNSFKRKRRTFRFNRVFAPDSTQEDIFNVIAKPIIQEVFDGLNATIFAYGATGSGKTYTLTGSQHQYEERGLIPRTIEYIFKLVTNNMSNYMFFISYLEIYNENAYDLLNPKQNFTCIEELPRVIVLEDENGEAHFKNLCLKEVNTEKEAMRWLYSGDNNRTIAETPLNDYSSRSHCVFTVHVISKCHNSGNITRSKLNLVDLAGSERLHRMDLRGMTLNEARHINLSLHYLERVIQALSQKGKNHVPYRNSMMTFILRDSLGGNCLTAMLATLSMLNLNIEEAISTCKFAQRVCLIKLDANVNFVATPEKEIHFLRTELKRLRRQLNEKNNVNKKLTREEEDECKLAVRQFLMGKEDLIRFDDARKVKYYIECLRDKLLKQSSSNFASNSVKSVKDVEKKYQQLIEQKDEEINMLMSVYDARADTKSLFKPVSTESLFNGSRLNSTEKKEFKKYLSKNPLKDHYDSCVKQIKLRFHEAVRISQSLTCKQKQIEFTKRTMLNDVKPSEDLRMKLNLDQSFYREQLRRMHSIKGDIEDLKLAMTKIKSKIMEDYQSWMYSNRSKDAAFPLQAKKGNSHFHLPSTNSISVVEDFRVSSSSSTSGDHISAPRDLPTFDYDLPSLQMAICSKLDQTSSMKKMCFKARGMRESSTQLPEMEMKTLPTMIIKDGGVRSSYVAQPQSWQSVSISAPMVPYQSERSSTSSNHSQTAHTGFFCTSHRQHESPMNPAKRTCSLVMRPSPCSYMSTGCKENIENLPMNSTSEVRKSVLTRSRRTTESPQFSLLQCKSADYICNYSSDQCTSARKSTKPENQPAPSCYKFLLPDDGPEFVTYLKTIPLTGDDDVDAEIIKFYRLKYKRRQIKSLVRK